MILRIDGTDISNWIAADGHKWSRNDIDGPGAGRTMNGTEIRDRLATKMRLELKCHRLTTAQHDTLEQLLYPEFVRVYTYDPLQGGYTTKTMYCNTGAGGFSFHHPDGTEYWDGISFILVEQ